MKKLIVFDLDGTLAESKTSLTPEMASLLRDLGQAYHLGIISGGDFLQYQQCVLPHVDYPELQSKMYLLPTSGGKVYQYKNGEWLQVFGVLLTPEEKEEILRAIYSSGVLDIYAAEQKFGEVIEDRDSQFTVSILGQEAPSEIKRGWDPDKAKRKLAVNILAPLLPEFDIRYGGSTSIEIAKKGIDKAFGIQKLAELTGFSQDEMLFFGDSMEEDGNDYPVKLLGVESIAVANPDETKEHLITLLRQTS